MTPAFHFGARICRAPGIRRKIPRAVCQGDFVVARAGIEPATFRFSGGRSYQLSYLAAGTRTECHTRSAGFLRRLLATLTGLEPATSAVTGPRANQLRHRAMLCYQQSEDCTPYGIRTRATALKGRRPRPLDEGGSSRISPDRLSTVSVGSSHSL